MSMYVVTLNIFKIILKIINHNFCFITIPMFLTKCTYFNENFHNVHFTCSLHIYELNEVETNFLMLLSGKYLIIILP